MSTHNIGFYEDLTKIIFELSSNIIKYAPYFFCCFLECMIPLVSIYMYMNFCHLASCCRLVDWFMSEMVRDLEGRFAPDSVHMLK